MIRVKIVPNDSKKVAKVVIINDDTVLMLKRSDYVEKFAGEWDLPGGHIKVGEALETGMTREVREETGLIVKDPVFIQDIDNLSFFYCEYDNKPIKLSHEHTAFRFFGAKNLDPNAKFEKIALKALEMHND
tara:strand:- start:1033 stop:1425 length:393 start_codon:yes stop_codon:yes gene_type:complete